MDKNSRTLLTVLAAVGSVAVVAVLMLWMDRSQLARELATAGETEAKLRSELAAAGDQAIERAAEQERKSAEQQRKTADVEKKLEAILHPPVERPVCIDSDADRGIDAIFVRGRVRTGGGEVTDHCRLGQLVEFSCLENPRGSGRFLADAKIMECPDGSRCLEGECLR